MKIRYIIKQFFRKIWLLNNISKFQRFLKKCNCSHNCCLISLCFFKFFRNKVSENPKFASTSTISQKIINANVFSKFQETSRASGGKKDCVKKGKLIEGITNDLVRNTLKQPSINAKEDFLSFYGQNEEIQSEKLGKLIETSFLNQLPETLKSEQIHNHYLCQQRKCNDKCLKIISFNING